MPAGMYRVLNKLSIYRLLHIKSITSYAFFLLFKIVEILQCIVNLTLRVSSIIYVFFYYHYVKSVRIRSFSGLYSVRMRENTDQKNFEYGHFSRSVVKHNIGIVMADNSQILPTF